MQASSVILDSDLIPRGISRKFVKFPGEAQEHFFARVTHMHLQNQKVYQIGDVSAVPNLTVLYLYGNRLTKIEHLDAVPHLQMLYLQKNKINKIENLSHLKQLKKLYLSCNKISVIENLEDLTKLEELHVDHQDLGPHQNVVFDPRSCSKFKKLRVINAAKNRMVDLKPLDLITSLHNLDISHNLLEDLQDVIDVLSRIPGLKVLDQRGNPFTSMLRYREHVIGSCCYLNTVDGKAIEPRSRIMMVNLHKMRLRTDSSISKASNSNSGSESSERLEKDPKPVGPAPTFDVSCESGKTGFSGDNSDPPTTSSSSMTPNPNIEDIEEDKSCKSEGPIPTINLNFKNER